MEPIFELLDNISNKTTHKVSTSDYNPYMINRFLSSHIDCLLLVNEMNKHHELDPDMQYTFLFSNIRKAYRRFSFKKDYRDQKISIIMKFLGYNRRKALEVESLFMDDQILKLKEVFDNESVKKR